MSITVTQVFGSGSAANGRIYSTPSFTPAANELVLFAVVGHHTTTGVNGCTVAHEGGLTFSQVAHVEYNTSASSQETLVLFSAMGDGTQTAGTCSITWTITDSNTVYTLDSFAGVNTGGTQGSSAVGSVMTGSTNSGTGLSLTLLSMGANDASYGTFQIPLASATGITTGSGYTELHQVQPTGEALDLMTEWNVPGTTTVDATWATRAGGGIAVQIVAAAAGGGPTPKIYDAQGQTWRQASSVKIYDAQAGVWRTAVAMSIYDAAAGVWRVSL